MTMTRAARADHADTLTCRVDRHYVPAKFLRPDHAAAALAERGHTYMTPAEYRAVRLHRVTKNTYRLDAAIAERAALRRRQRVVAARLLAGPGRRRRPVERRITGLTPGTKNPARWTQTGTGRALTRR